MYTKKLNGGRVKINQKNFTEFVEFMSHVVKYKTKTKTYDNTTYCHPNCIYIVIDIGNLD